MAGCERSSNAIPWNSRTGPEPCWRASRSSDRGASACMLFTDAVNPTSNAIYQRIGYRQVGTAAEYRFRYR